MKNDTWDILTKELALYGIKLINARECSVFYNGKFIRMPTEKAMISLRKRLFANGKIFEELLEEFIEILNKTQTFGTKDPLDDLSLNYFINTLKDTHKFFTFIAENFDFNNESLKYTLAKSTKDALNKDYTEFSKEIILELPNYKIGLDWVFRKMSLLEYVKSMLRFARLGPSRLSQIQIKTARGVSGPRANLDLPKLERMYPWNNISEEMRGRQKDKQKQRRYRMGFEHYNDPYGRVGEGQMWLEVRNQPFLFSKRDTDSPYPSRKTLSGWG